MIPRTVELVRHVLWLPEVVLNYNQERFMAPATKYVLRAEFDEMSREIEKLNIRFEVLTADSHRLDNRVGDLFEAIEELSDRMDARFDKMDSRLEKMDSRLDKMDSRLDTMDSRLDEMGFAIRRDERFIPAADEVGSGQHDGAALGDPRHGALNR